MNRKERRARAGLKPETIDLKAEDVTPVAEAAAVSEGNSASDTASGEPTERPSETVVEHVDPAKADAETVVDRSEPEPVFVDEAIANARAEEPARVTEPPTSTPRRSGRVRAWALGLLAATLLGAGGMWWLTNNYLPGNDDQIASLTARLQKAESTIDSLGRDLADAKSSLATLKDKVDPLAAQVASGGKPVADPAVAAQLTSQAKSVTDLQAAVKDLRAALSNAASAAGGAAQAIPTDVTQKIGELDQRLKDLDAKVAALPPPPPSAQPAVDALAGRVDGLEKKVTEGLEKAQSAQQPAAVLAPLNALAARIAGGQPFAQDLDAAIAAAPTVTALQSLKTLAPAGVPTLAALQTAYANVAASVTAATEPPPAPAESGFWNALTSRLENVVKVHRREDVVWPETVKAATPSVEKGDIAAALTILSATANPPQAVADWMRGAKARIDADVAIKAALQDAVQQVSASQSKATP
ncbi:MAG: hypothetical protein U1E46_05085 [Hyphomicrobiales bacterium]